MQTKLQQKTQTQPQKNKKAWYENCKFEKQMDIMKKSVLFIAGLCLAFGAVAQKANVVSAYNYMKKKEFGKAYSYIEKAVANEKTGLDAKTWFYRGNIIQGCWGITQHIRKRNDCINGAFGPDLHPVTAITTEH